MDFINELHIMGSFLNASCAVVAMRPRTDGFPLDLDQMESISVVGSSSTEEEKCVAERHTSPLPCKRDRTQTESISALGSSSTEDEKCAAEPHTFPPPWSYVQAAPAPCW